MNATPNLATPAGIASVLSKLDVDRRADRLAFREATASIRARTVADRRARTRQLDQAVAAIGAVDEPGWPTRSGTMDDEGLRRLGAEIIACAVEDARRSAHRGGKLDSRDTARQEARAWLVGAGLDRCCEVFGVQVEPDAIRRALPPTVADRRTRLIERARLRFC